MSAQSQSLLVSTVPLPESQTSAFLLHDKQAMPPSTRGSLKQQPGSRREQQLLSSLSFYGAYHFQFWNRVVHCIFVPAIWW
jgi:hypothetical protein